MGRSNRPGNEDLIMLHPLLENAARVLDGGALTRTEALALAEELPADDLLDLISLANKVRKKFAPAITA